MTARGRSPRRRGDSGAGRRQDVSLPVPCGEHGRLRSVPDYDLTRLGSRAFEQLIVALCLSELGPGMQVFGDGPDGGREATFSGTVRWASTSLAGAAAGAADYVAPGARTASGS